MLTVGIVESPVFSREEDSFVAPLRGFDPLDQFVYPLQGLFQLWMVSCLEGKPCHTELRQTELQMEDGAEERIEESARPEL